MSRGPVVREPRQVGLEAFGSLAPQPVAVLLQGLFPVLLVPPHTLQRAFLAHAVQFKHAHALLPGSHGECAQVPQIKGRGIIKGLHQFLADQGYDARSVSGGTAAWVSAQLPIDA